MKNLIIVTGGAGFVGSNLIKTLLKKTNKIVIDLINDYSLSGATINGMSLAYIHKENNSRYLLKSSVTLFNSRSFYARFLPEPMQCGLAMQEIAGVHSV